MIDASLEAPAFALARALAAERVGITLRWVITALDPQEMRVQALHKFQALH